jgi:diguanylate cyclase (GGDEF)-like protein/PAS domain S-box-containing protein
MKDIENAPLISLIRSHPDALQTVLDLISDGIWDWNADTGFVWRSIGWYEMLGYSSHRLRNTVHTWENVIHPEDLERVMAHFDDYIHERSPSYQVQYRCKCRDGGYVWIEDRARVITRNQDRSVARMIGAHRRMHEHTENLERKNQSLEALVVERTLELQDLNTKLREYAEESRALAETDALTGAANRYRLELVLNQEFERARRFRQPLSVIAMDIDDFKGINDQYGHSEGDIALIRVAQAIKSCLREVDLLARWGGDEFMLVLPNTNGEGARAVAGRVQKLIAALPPVGERRIALSFGVAQAERNETQEAFIVRADRALYRSKRAGKNAISGWEHEPERPA